jgi:CDP-glycerol glycerophosphotransferase (TagB/SpsB family)
MTYTEAADLYLGDVSSQIYEFLRRPRPCAFIDSHATDWQGDGNFRHWTCGKVLESADDLLAAVDEAFASHADYVAEQRRLFAYSIDLRETPSSRRGAEAILAFVRRTFPQRAMAFDAGGAEAFGQLAG